MRVLQWYRKFFYTIISTGHSKGTAQKNQPVLILGDGKIEFDTNVTFGFFPSPYFLSGYAHIEARGQSSSIIFGKDTHINNNFVAVAEHTSITIGKKCLIGTNVEIYDSDFHGIKISDRGISDPQKAKAVQVGDHVFIGSNVKIMKGAEIGSGSVVGNGSIVVGKIPSNVIAIGNPVRILRKIQE